EVDLHHPRRDRERGRIWRIVYKGPKGAPASPPRADWTRATVAELIGDLRSPNLTVRTVATNELVRRGGDAVTAPVRALFGSARGGEHGSTEDDHATVWAKSHGLWILERCGALDATTLAAALRDESFAVRVHAQKVLAERSHWTAEDRAASIAALKDPN